MKRQTRQEPMTEREFNERAARELKRFTRRLKREATSNALQQQTTRLRQLWRIARSS